MADEPKPGEVTVCVSESLDGVDIVNADYRINYSFPHLTASIRFSKIVGDVQRENAGREFGEFWDIMQANAIACVMTAVSALEAYANEIFVDRNRIFSKDFAREIDELIRISGKDMKSFDIISKFELYAYAVRRSRIDRSIEVYRNISALIELRNAIVHFVPEMNSEADRHKRLSTKLQGCLIPTPFIPAQGEALFPRRWISGGSTEWVVRTVIEFIRYYERLTGVPDNFTGIEAMIGK